MITYPVKKDCSRCKHLHINYLGQPANMPYGFVIYSYTKERKKPFIEIECPVCGMTGYTHGPDDKRHWN